MKKVILTIVIAFGVLLIAAIVIAGLSLDGIVKRGVETVGPKFAKVDVKLDKVALSILSGSGEIDGLILGNPAGFHTSQAVSVGHASLAIAPGSLLSSKIIIKSISLDAAEITLETGTAGNNLKKILANLNESTASTSNDSNDAKGTAKPADTGSGKKLEVDDFLITGAQLHLSITGLGSTTVPLPRIHLTDLGKGEAGITTAELTKLVMAAIEKDAAQAAANSAGDIAKGASGIVKGLTGGTNNSIGKLGKGVGDLFKKK